MEKTQQIIKSCRVQVNGRTYCIWKIPESENPKVRGSALAGLIRNVTPETLINVMETARDIIYCDKTNFGYSCEKITIDGCNTFENYRRRLNGQTPAEPHFSEESSS
jgi:hypothetical protein